MFDRDTVLKDLRTNAIAFFLKEGDVKTEVRCSLMPTLLPEKYLTEMDQEQSFHNSNPTKVAAWNILKGGWVVFDIADVEFVQVLDENQY